jgi:hypothetical protein
MAKCSFNLKFSWSWDFVHWTHQMGHCFISKQFHLLGAYLMVLFVGFTCLCSPGLDAESFKFSTAVP